MVYNALTFIVTLILLVQAVWCLYREGRFLYRTIGTVSVAASADETDETEKPARNWWQAVGDWFRGWPKWAKITAGVIGVLLTALSLIVTLFMVYYTMVGWLIA